MFGTVCQHLVTQTNGTCIDCGHHVDLDPQVADGPPALTLGAIEDEFSKAAGRAIGATGPRVIRAFRVISNEFAKRQREDFTSDD